VTRYWHRLITVAVTSSLIGCTAWTTTHAPVSSLDGEKVRLTTADGGRFEGLLMHPDTLGESVLLCMRDSSQPLVIDMSTVKSAETRKIHEGHTMGLALFGVGAVVFTIVQIKMVFNDPDY
jgi:hypothetical protein